LPATAHSGSRSAAGGLVRGLSRPKVGRRCRTNVDPSPGHARGAGAANANRDPYGPGNQGCYAAVAGILGAFGLFAIWRTFSSPTAARGEGAGRALIEALVTLGREHGWRRVYWHTHENNERARTLYDRLAKRTDYVRYDIEF